MDRERERGEIKKVERWIGREGERGKDGSRCRDGERKDRKKR